MKVTFEGNNKEIMQLLKNLSATGNSQEISKDIDVQIKKHLNSMGNDLL
ncbi:hypothetical protein M2S00_06900 [Apilactobacillus sp. TMW 2.2459]|nr:hypothetical protein [Apilactobacillus xinyiensis]MCL0312833.1 hypothetical protein [Apilactobacillus xinyiensis]